MATGINSDLSLSGEQSRSSSTANGVYGERGWRLSSTAGYLIRMFLGCIFLISGLAKLHNLYDFLVTVDRFELLGPQASVGLAMIVPFFELVLAACLIVNLAVRPAQFLSAGFLLLLAGILASVVYRGIHTNCGCFGQVDASDVTWMTVGRTGALFCFAIFGLYLDSKRRAKTA